MLLDVMLLLALTQGGEHDCHPNLPPLADTHQFEHHLANQQLLRIREHRKKLAELAPAWPERREDFEAWQRQSKWLEDYWRLLDESTDRRESPFHQRQALFELRKHLGPDRYREGWTPWLIPENLWGLPEVPQ